AARRSSTMRAMPAGSLLKLKSWIESERARSSLSCATSMPTYIGSAAGPEVEGEAGDTREVMRGSLSCECERVERCVERLCFDGSVDCSGEWTRERPGPRFVAAVAGRATIGRGPLAVSA